MKKIIHWLILFSIFIVNSFALECTTNCSYQVLLNRPFYISKDCKQKISAGSCFLQTTIWYDRGYYVVVFGSYESSYILKDRYHAMVQLSDDGSVAVSYSLEHSCKGTDDCARNVAQDKMDVFLQRPNVNYISLFRKLSPLLYGDNTTTDLVCFNGKDALRQCSIPTIRGVCELKNDLKKNQVERQCDHELVGSTRHVSAYQSGDYATFSIKCNRSFCNGHLTLEAVKRVMFEHGITATLDGRLNDGSIVIVSLGYYFFLITFLFLMK